MTIINIADTNAADKLAEWARDAYISACHQISADQWTAEAAGYPDGRIECYGIIYGNSTSEDIYNGRAHSVLVIHGEIYDNVETEANYDDDPQGYQEEIDDLINCDAREMYGDSSQYYPCDSNAIDDALTVYRDWISDQEQAADDLVVG